MIWARPFLIFARPFLINNICLLFMPFFVVDKKRACEFQKRVCPYHFPFSYSDRQGEGECFFLQQQARGGRVFFFYSNKQGEGECFFFTATSKGRKSVFLFFLSASSSGIANIICMVAGIIYFEKPVRSGIHSTSVIAR